MSHTFDYELIHTTAVILSTGSGDKYEQCAADISEGEITAIAVALADHSHNAPYLRNDEEAYVQTGWLVVDRNNDGDCFTLTDAGGQCITEATPERAQELFLAYIRESVENDVEVSDDNLALIA